MPIQRRSAPTLSGVARQIEIFERRYDISTDVFLLNDHRSRQVDENDGMQWSYLIEQREVLTEVAVGQLYANGCDSGPLKNRETSPELLAA
jgi:hypothetical protein